ncbi:MAG: biotin--[Prevotella sp.]|nr:biotin--[acetyl-CoA-carboxylase] ligase [Prevotella sp.]
MSFKIIFLSETDSTNRWLKEHGGDEDLLVWTDFQTAGRGCGSNHWESQQGRNLLFSVLLHPRGVEAHAQFILSMANAMALKAALDELTDGIEVKWPNDIYWHDRKLAGTLIETTLSSNHVKTCILGTGLNVNQSAFHSDAPNPVSLCQILGHSTDREALLQHIAHHLSAYMELVEQRRWDDIRGRYRQALYRRDGQPHWFRLPDGSRLLAKLKGVEDGGSLLLVPQDNKHKELRFGFKEIQFII